MYSNKVLTVHCEHKVLHFTRRATKHCVWCNTGIVARITPVHWGYGENRGSIEDAIVTLHCHWLYTQSRIWVHELSVLVPPCDIHSWEASGSTHKGQWVCFIDWYGSRLLRRQDFSWSCGGKGLHKWWKDESSTTSLLVHKRSVKDNLNSNCIIILIER